MKTLLLLSTLIMTSTTWAGGSSTVGPGAPMIVFACFDSQSTTYVQLYRSPVDAYKTFQLGITDIQNNQSSALYVGKAKDVSQAAPGSGRRFESGDYVLSVASGNAPQMDPNGVPHFAAFITKTSASTVLTLDCRAY